MPLIQSSVEFTLVDYFSQRIQEYGEQISPPPQEDTIWYMSSVLARFGDSEQLFSYDNGEVSIRPLALLYKDALESQQHHERCLILRHLGDLALFLGALFPERYAKRGVLKDYFVGMGGSAYSYLSENARQNRHIFRELAATFAKMLELIARACSREQAFDASDVLQLYRRYQQSGDPYLAEQLRSLGIAVISSSDSLH